MAFFCSGLKQEATDLKSDPCKHLRDEARWFAAYTASASGPVAVAGGLALNLHTQQGPHEPRLGEPVLLPKSTPHIIIIQYEPIYNIYINTTTPGPTVGPQHAIEMKEMSDV